MLVQRSCVASATPATAKSHKVVYDEIFFRAFLFFFVPLSETDFEFQLYSRNKLQGFC